MKKQDFVKRRLMNAQRNLLMKSHVSVFQKIRKIKKKTVDKIYVQILFVIGF